MPRKANQSLQNEVEQKINIKNKDKGFKVRMESCPGEGVVKEKKFPCNRKPSHSWHQCRLWNHRGQQNGKKKKKKEKKKVTTEFVLNGN